MPPAKTPTTLKAIESAHGKYREAQKVVTAAVIACEQARTELDSAEDAHIKASRNPTPV